MRKCAINNKFTKNNKNGIKLETKKKEMTSNNNNDNNNNNNNDNAMSLENDGLPMNDNNRFNEVLITVTNQEMYPWLMFSFSQKRIKILKFLIKKYVKPSMIFSIIPEFNQIYSFPQFKQGIQHFMCP